MRLRTTKILYWVITILFVAAMMMSGILELMQTEQSQEVMEHLGYPLYLNIILGVAKILGVLALLNLGLRQLKNGRMLDLLSTLLGLVCPCILLVIVF